MKSFYLQLHWQKWLFSVYSVITIILRSLSGWGGWGESCMGFFGVVFFVCFKMRNKSIQVDNTILDVL